jgi:hypothetical protein
MKGWRPQYDGDFPTLGWGVLEHATAFLPSPADEALPWVFTDEQARRVLRFYELDPETGEFIVRRRRDEEAKGWGKSPDAAALSIEEFVGPVCFDGFDADGQPVGVPWGTGTRPPPWLQIAAVSEDQTDNTYVSIYEMLGARGGRVAEELGIDLGRTRLYLRGRRGRLEPVTASAGSRSGQRITFAVLDETHLWTPRNGGIKLAATIRQNLAKMGGRSLETCNAPILGEKSVAEESGTPEAGVLQYATRPSKEPQPDWSDEQLLDGLREVYRDAPWMLEHLERLLAEIHDPATTWDDALRFYFNIRSAGIARAADPRAWDALKAPRDVPAKTRIGAGFDGSVSRDATVLRGCTADGYRFTIESWVRPRGRAMDVWQAKHPGEDWHVPRLEVNAAIDRMFVTWDVGLMLYDPPYWYSEGEAWQRRYGEDRVKPLDTNQARLFAPIVDRWRTDIAAGKPGFTHDGDPVVTSHVLAAHLRKVRLIDPDDDGRTRYVLVKGDDRGLIDGAIADALAGEAAATMGEAAPKPKPLVVMGRPWGEARPPRRSRRAAADPAGETVG